MNIAILLAGVTSDSKNSISGDAYGRIRKRDWKLSAPFVKSQIIDCWEGHHVKTYIATYDHDEFDQMLDFYKPEKHIVVPDAESNMILTILKGLELLRGEDIDFVVVTRPDIKFFKKLSKYNINFDKFNFLWKERSGMWDEFGTLSIDTTGEITGTVGKAVGWDPLKGIKGYLQFNYVVDTLFMCPNFLLEEFMSAVHASYYDPENLFTPEGVHPGWSHCTLHGLWNYLHPKIGGNNIHWMFPDRYFSGNSPISDFRNENKVFGSPPHQYEYFLVREPDHNLEPWNHNEDWVSFVKEPIQE